MEQTKIIPPPARVAAEGPTLGQLIEALGNLSLVYEAQAIRARKGSIEAEHWRRAQLLQWASSEIRKLSHCSACGLTHDAETCPRCAPTTLVGRLYALAREVRAQAAERMRWRSVPCQTDQSWHAEEFNEWAYEIESVARSMEGRKEQS